MRVRKLADRLTTLKETSRFQHKVIDSIISIMSLKKKAETDYQSSLENINRELEKYLIDDYGFLTDTVKLYQSFIIASYQNQNALVESYETEVLTLLVKAKDCKLEDDLITKVQFVDAKMKEFQDNIKRYKKLLRQNQEDLQSLSFQKTFKNKTKLLEEKQIEDIQNIKKANEKALEKNVDGVMQLVSISEEILQSLDQYQKSYLQKKACNVYDRFIQAFIGEGFFLRSLNNDMEKILGSLNENNVTNKQIAYENMRSKVAESKGLKDSLFEVYAKLTTADNLVDINEQYISEKIREKWKKICHEYNKIGAEWA